MSPELTFVVGQYAFQNWSRLEWDSDLLTPTDAWSAELVSPTPEQIEALTPGQTCVLLYGRTVVLRGLVERRALTRTREGTTLAVSGRDYAAPLVDCAPSTKWVSQGVTLEGLAKRAATDLGVALSVAAHADAKSPLKQAKAEPGETYWGILERYAKRARLNLWCTSAGVLTLDRPDYTSAPVGELRHLARGASNVLRAELQEDLTGRFSHVTVLAQARSSDDWYGESPAQLKGTSIDDEIVALGLYRPTVLDEGEAGSNREAEDRASWEVSHRAFQGTRLTYTVPGLGPSATTLWTPNSQVTVRDEVFGVRSTRWILGARISVSREAGATTTLDLRRPHLLLPEVA